jgi:hypothetical protein
MANNMNGSQKFLQRYNVEWHSLKAAQTRERPRKKATVQDLPSYQEVRGVFEECMRTRELPGNRFSISNLKKSV